MPPLPAAASFPTKNDLLECHQRIRPFIHRTPVMTSTLLDELAETTLFFKCENFQKMGAFKMRGALNAILQLPEASRSAGVVTHSSGNFGQAVALAARNLGVPAFIVMPHNAPEVKKAAVRAYGGIITESEATIEARQAAADKIIADKGASFLHPSNDPEVILGQGTAALELLEDHPDLDFIIAPVGGGGLLAGTALAAAYFGKNCRTFAGEPLAADDAYRSLKSGKIETNTKPQTIADGLRTHLGHHNFPIIQKHVNQIIRVEENEIITAMKLIWERMKIVIEPSSAVPLAAVFREKKIFKDQKVGVILSGGNVDLASGCRDLFTLS